MTFHRNWWRGWRVWKQNFNTANSAKQTKRGFTISLSNSGSLTQGVVLLNQARIIDLDAHCARFIEQLDETVVNDALLKFSVLVESDQ